MVEQSRVNDRYKAKFGSIGLSKTRLDAMSAKLAAKIKDDATDEEIDGELDDLNEVYPFSEIKKNDDRALNDKNNPNKKKDDEKVEVKTDDNDVLSLLKSMKEEITSLKNERTQETISQKFANDERVKNIPEFIRKGFVPTSNEDYETNVEALVAEYKPFAEKHKLEQFSGSDAPAGSTDTSQAKGKVTPISAEEAKAIIS